MRAAVLAWCLLAVAPARADEAVATTYLLVRPRPVAGAPVYSAPILEHVAFSGTVQGWELRASLWGWVELTGGAADADTLNVSGALPKGGRLVLGRQLLLGGAARMLRLDGVRVLWDLPAGFRAEAYTGLLAKPRFAFDRQAWAYGARVAWRPHALAEAGLSFAETREQGWPAGRRVGLDAHFGPWSSMHVAGRAIFELRELRPLDLEIYGDAPWGTLAYRFTSPDLLLPADSVLSVFAATSLHEAGGDLRWQWIGGGGRVVFHPGGGVGGWVGLRAAPGGVGGELRRTWTPQSAMPGGFTARAWVARPVGQVMLAGEAVGDLLDAPVNGRRDALAARASASFRIEAMEATALVELSTGPYAERALAAMVRIGWHAEWRPAP